MSLIKKSDVKNHLSPQFRTKINPCEPVSQPDTTGYSVAETDATPVYKSDKASHAPRVPTSTSAAYLKHRSNPE
jgi:hypothetical protein